MGDLPSCWALNTPSCAQAWPTLLELNLPLLSPTLEASAPLELSALILRAYGMKFKDLRLCYCPATLSLEHFLSESTFSCLKSVGMHVRLTKITLVDSCKNWSKLWWMRKYLSSSLLWASLKSGWWRRWRSCRRYFYFSSGSLMRRYV